MNPDQIIQILSTATQPQAAGRLTREDYVNIHAALQGIDAMTKELVALKAAAAKVKSEKAE